MRPSTFLGLSLLTVVLPFAAYAEPHANPAHHRHRDIAHRARGDVQLHKRYDNARFTFYDVGLCVSRHIIRAIRLTMYS